VVYVTAAASLDLGDDKKVRWVLENTGNTDVFIERVFVSWPNEHKKLRHIKLGPGVHAFKDINDTVSPTDVPTDKAAISDTDARRLPGGRHG
jgi:hypothetical protein